MEENILRIVQLALAINQTDIPETRVSCSVHIYTNGYIEVRIFGNEKFGSIPRFKLCYHYARYDREGIAECTRYLEDICRKLGIDISERHIKVKVC